MSSIQHQMFFPFAEVEDDFGHYYTTRTGKSTPNLDQALRVLHRVARGEIRDEHNRIVAIKSPNLGVRIVQ